MDDDSEELKARIQELEDELQKLKQEKGQEYTDSAAVDEEIEEVHDQIRDEAENSGMSRRKFMKAIAGSGAALGAAAMMPSAAALDIESNNPLSYNSNFSVDTQGHLDLQGKNITNAGSVGASSISTEVSRTEDSPIADVTAYGAEGDGETDDTAAIQAAFNAGVAHVHFPPTGGGEYKINGTITVPGHVQRISGSMETVRNYDANAHCFEVTPGVDHFKIENIVTRHESKGDGDGWYFDGTTDVVHNIIVDQCIGTNHRNGFFVDGSSFLFNFRQCRSNSCDTGYKAMGNTSTTFVFDQCYSNADGTGFRVDSVKEVEFRQPTIDNGNGPGIHLSIVRQAEITDLHMESRTIPSTEGAVYVKGYTQNVSVDGANIEDCDGDGALIYIQSTGPEEMEVRRVWSGDQNSNTLDRYVVDEGSGESGTYRFEHNRWGPIAGDFVSIDGSGVLIRENLASESADAEMPQNNYPVGTVISFTDSGDGSGDGTYIATFSGFSGPI